MDRRFTTQVTGWRCHGNKINHQLLNKWNGYLRVVIRRALTSFSSIKYNEYYWYLMISAAS